MGKTMQNINRIFGKNSRLFGTEIAPPARPPARPPAIILYG